MEKQVSYQHSNTYETLNKLTEETKYVWLVFHGLGYLSRYFIRHFKTLDPKENYIISPQAPSKYYADKSYTKVGASWLTKENTIAETENVLNYVDAVITNENISLKLEFIVLGFSQGVSIAARWLAKRQPVCDRFIMISGKFPSELTANQIQHLQTTKVMLTIGKNDPLISSELAKQQIERLKQLFPNIKEVHHDGGHKINSLLFKEYLQ